MPKILVHDDGPCADGSEHTPIVNGMCPVCKFHPDAQSTALVDVQDWSYREHKIVLTELPGGWRHAINGPLLNSMTGMFANTTQAIDHAAGMIDRAVLGKSTEFKERPAHDLTREEVLLLQRYPYDYPAAIPTGPCNPGDKATRRTALRMVRQGFLEFDPTSKRRIVRCTQRGMDAVAYFKKRGWLEK